MLMMQPDSNFLSHQRSIASRWSGAFFLGLLMLAMTSITGCNIVTPAAYLIEGPPTVEAAYILPEQKIVVFIDDRSSKIPRTRLRRIITDRATNELLRVEQLVPAAIDSGAASRLVQQEDNANLLSIDEIGRRLGAEIVIYVRPLEFNVISNGAPRPTATMAIKVIDVATGQKLFPPKMSTGEHVLTAQMAFKPGSAYTTGDSLRALQEALADLTGLRIAQVFYKHETNPLNAEVSR